MTAARKLKNQMAFGPGAQNEDMQTGESYGLLGQSGQASGILRGVQSKRDRKLDKKKGFDQIPKFNQNNAFVNDIKGKDNPQIGGMTSSLVMTPMQGISLVNPDINLKR